MYKRILMSFFLLSSFSFLSGTSQTTFATSLDSTIAISTIFSNLEARNPVFTISLGTNTTMINKDINTALQKDTYLANDISGFNLSISNGVVTFHVNYRESKAQYSAVLQGVNYVIHKIIKPWMDVYTKEEVVHNFVVLNTAYDTSLKNYTAYDALYKHSATCQGYAMLTYQLLKAVGIPNIIVTGTATVSGVKEAHAWNEVDLNGKWYQLDTTWDDPVPNVKGRVMFNYFNLTSAQLSTDHIWNKKGLPIANSNYISVLENSKVVQDSTILSNTGLYAEESNYTFNTLAELQTFLAPLTGGKSIDFRYPYSSISNFNNLSLPYAYSLSYTRDTRDTYYALIIFTAP